MTIDDQIAKLGKATLLGYFEHDSDEWHEARKGVAGSLISSIMGHNPWRSAYTAYHEVQGLLDRESDGPSMAMKLGTVFEAPIRDLWISENQEWFKKAHTTGTWASKKHPEFKANPDAIIEWTNGELSLLEVKFSRNPMTELPLHYYDQVMWYLHVLGLDKGILVACANGELVEHEITYDAVYAQQLEDAALRWLECLRTGEVPDWDGSQSTYETVRELSEGIFDGDIELGELYLELIAAKENYDLANTQFTLVKSKTLKLMDGTKNGLYNGDKVVSLSSRGGGLPYLVFKRG
jgi:predicted phage-related endonuclease